jgi:flavin reductase (DIM6/NTAB) family NADH-FMN oxidoreductase RutF
MAATVVPRPIAWVTTQSDDGTVNAAPFSFFNVMGHRPPTAVLGLLRDPRKGFKDTAGNILARGDFVINLVPERLATAMNLTSMAAPAAVSELEAAGLTPAPSAHVRPPRIAESPVAFECVNHASVVTGPEQTIVIARILAIHIDDAHVLDAERGHVDTTGLGLIPRLEDRPRRGVALLGQAQHRAVAHDQAAVEAAHDHPRGMSSCQRRCPRSASGAFSSGAASVPWWVKRCATSA